MKPQSDKPDAAFAYWAVVELMGHGEIAGYVTEQTIAGTAFIRVDVPAISDIPAYTKLYGTAAIYCLTPTAEDVVFKYMERYGAKPLRIFDAQPLQPSLLPARETDDEIPC